MKNKKMTLQLFKWKNTHSTIYIERTLNIQENLLTNIPSSATTRSPLANGPNGSIPNARQNLRFL